MKPDSWLLLATTKERPTLEIVHADKGISWAADGVQAHVITGQTAAAHLKPSHLTDAVLGWISEPALLTVDLPRRMLEHAARAARAIEAPCLRIVAAKAYWQASARTHEASSVWTFRDGDSMTSRLPGEKRAKTFVLAYALAGQPDSISLDPKRLLKALRGMGDMVRFEICETGGGMARFASGDATAVIMALYNKEDEEPIPETPE
jgi:hypothetical protein